MSNRFDIMQNTFNKDKDSESGFYTNLARTGFQGISAGFGDEIEAGVGAAYDKLSLIHI